MRTLLVYILLMCAIPVDGQVSQQGITPGFPISLGVGGHHHHHNHDYPDWNGSYNGEYGTTQSNEHMVWYTVHYPEVGWYRLRFDCQSPFRPTWANEDKGAQLAIWRPQDMGNVYDPLSPYFTTGGGFFNIYMSQEVYIYIDTPGDALFVFDGYGHSVGKYYVTYDRVHTSPWGMVMPVPNPTYAPYPAESTIYLQ